MTDKTWRMKNVIENKQARRELIEGNVVENAWPDAQAALLPESGVDRNTPWPIRPADD